MINYVMKGNDQENKRICECKKITGYLTVKIEVVMQLNYASLK